MWAFGTHVENEMAGAERALTKSTKGKATVDEIEKARMGVFRQYVPEPPEDKDKPPPKGKYADPAVFANNVTIRRG